MARTPTVDRAKLRQVVDDLERAAQHKRENKLFVDGDQFYEKQRSFFKQGAHKRERLFMAGNRTGKSECGAFETTCHLTGLYPYWWEGKRFNRPVRGWAAGVSSTVVRDVQQTKLCGDYSVSTALGTGWIPKALFVDKPSLARGVTDAFDTIQVRHCTDGVYDGISTLRFKSYEQGRISFQGDQIDFGWGDEEPEKFDVYSEFLTRISADGIMFSTFTPLFGKTDLTEWFAPDPKTGRMHPDRGLSTMTLYDAKHFTPQEIEQRIAGMPAHEVATRVRGVPMAGSGRVFNFTDEAVKEAPIEHIPAHWYKIWGIDFGIGHPFAAVLLLWDRDLDIIHVHHAIRMQDEHKLSLPLHHALAMKPIGGEVPVAWPQDGAAREKGTGIPLMELYRAQGLKMIHEHAQWESGGNSTEAGIKEMEERFATGRLKVAHHLSDWFEEFLSYHRKDGIIVKSRDDLMSATRVGIMHKRFSKAVQLGPKGSGAWRLGRAAPIVQGADFDPWNPRDDNTDIFTGEDKDPWSRFRR